MVLVAGRSCVLREGAVMLQQKINKTYRFSLLMFLEMLNKMLQATKFRSIGKRCQAVCA